MLSANPPCHYGRVLLVQPGSTKSLSKPKPSTALGDSRDNSPLREAFLEERLSLTRQREFCLLLDPLPYQSVLGEGQYRASNGGVGETRPRREFVGGLCSLGFDESLQNPGLTLAYIYQTRRVSRRQFSLESGSELYLIWSVSETDARELSVLVRESHDVRAIGLGSSRCP